MRSLKLSTGAVILLAACAMFAVAQLDAHARINNDSRVKTVSKKDPAPPPTLKISLNPVVGPPTTAVAISGTKFGRTEAVDVYFDSTDLLLAVTNSSGSFSQSLDVPTSAQPGTHWVTAVGRVSGLAAQASFLVQTNWSMFHYNLQHSGYNPFENTLNPGNVAGLNQAWAAPTGSVIYSSPAVANGVVYVASEDDKLYAFNAGPGVLLSGWPVSTGASILSSPAVANGVVYVGSDDDKLYAFNAVTGVLLSGWPVSTGSSIRSSRAVANGVVYVGSYDDKLYAFNAVTGAVLSGWPVSTLELISSSPAVANGVVYVGSYDGKLYAFNAVTGARLSGWPVSTGN
jgi:outer membrane protein assembly factor BamB